MPRKRHSAPAATRAGWIDALHDAFVATTRSVEDMQRAISRRPFDALADVPAVAPVARVVREAHDRIAGAVFDGLRGAAHVVRVGAAQLAHARIEDQAGPPGRERLRNAVNAAWGDQLLADGNPLALSMAVHADAGALALERAALRAALPDASARIVVFVHGLGCDERSWQPETGEGYGERLRASGWTPLYLRYNTGVAHADSGAALAQLLQQVLRAWPLPVSELALVGHSLGGLVVQLACEMAARRRLRWLRCVSTVVTLGTPHRGAPLERLGRLASRALRAHDIPAPLARLGDSRSAGVRGLGDAAQREPLPPAAQRALDAIAFRALGASLAPDPDSLLSRWLGDGLVPLDSAVGAPPARDFASAQLGGIGHLELLAHEQVWRQLAAWLQVRAAAPASREA